MFKYSMTESSQ